MKFIGQISLFALSFSVFQMDQLSTIPGWTGVVFLVHENEIRAGQKRVYTHSYSTRGGGRRIEIAMREKILNSMKIFLNMGKLNLLDVVKLILFVAVENKP